MRTYPPTQGPPESCFWSNRKATANRTLSSAGCLVPGTPQRGMQPLPYLVRPVVLGARTLLESLGLVWMAAALFACSRSACPEQLALWPSASRAVPAPLPGALFAPALGVAALLLLLEIGGGLSGIPLADLGRASLRRLRSDAFSAESRSCWIPSSDGRSECSAKRRFDPAGRLSTTPGLDIVAATTLGCRPLSRRPDGRGCCRHPRPPAPPLRAPLSRGRRTPWP